MTEVETFQKIDRKQGSIHPAISIYEHCIFINTLAVKRFKLHNVLSVEMYWSQEKNQVGFSSTDDPSKASFALSRVTSSGARVISCQGFINKYVRSVCEIKNQRQLTLEKSGDLLVATLER